MQGSKRATNFEFSFEPQEVLREQVPKFLAGRCLRQVVREAHESGAGYDLELRVEIALGSGVDTDGLSCLPRNSVTAGRSEAGGRPRFSKESSREA
jgi:hypothetical protein